MSLSDGGFFPWSNPGGTMLTGPDSEGALVRPSMPRTYAHHVS